MPIVINPNLCMSRKNTTESGKNLQCPNKRKYGEYCGKHRNNKNGKRVRIDSEQNKIIIEPKLSHYKNLLNNNPINNKISNNFIESTSQDNKNLKYQNDINLNKVTQLYKSNNNCLTILSYKQIISIPFSKLKVKNIKYNLDYYGINKKGKKKELYQILLHFLSTRDHCQHNIDKVILIQSLYRGNRERRRLFLGGPAIFKRSLCNNVTDFFTLEDIKYIPEKYFVSYRDLDGFIYGFDFRSIKQIIEYNQDNLCNQNNPYNRNPLSKEIKHIINEKNKDLIYHNQKTYYESSVLTFEQLVRDKIIQLFLKFNELGNYTDPDWFLKLNGLYLLKFYKFITYIWKYRVNLSNDMREKIIPGGNVCKITQYKLKRIKDINKLRLVIVEDITKFVTLGQSKDEHTLGSFYILSALSRVSYDCATSLPWLADF